MMTGISSPAPDQPSAGRERLRQHFLNSAPGDTGKWDDLWRAGDWLPWDRGVPNPALADTLREKQDLLGGSPASMDPATGVTHRKRALVPGCGKGYDVLLLASFGYDAYGLEASRAATEAAEQFAQQTRYPTQDEQIGSGSIHFVYGDFFEDDWKSSIKNAELGFELIYDYTFLSALHPSLRPAWSLRMSQLLAPDGVLVCVEFPTYKPSSTGGPPWGLPPVVYEQHLTQPGEEVPYDEEGNVVVTSVPKKNAQSLVRIGHWQPERTHEIGKGTDWVSVWKHA